MPENDPTNRKYYFINGLSDINSKEIEVHFLLKNLKDGT